MTMTSRNQPSERRLRGFLFWMFACALFSALCTPACATSDMTQDNMEALHIDQRNAYSALQYIAYKAHIVIGVDAIRSPKDGRIVFDFPGGTAADLLNAFTAQAPGFKWQQDGPIIHVFRTEGRVSLASVVIAYPGASQKSRAQIWVGLLSNPQVKRWMSANKCRERARLGPYAFIRRKHGPDAISVSPGLMTMSQLLDKVATQSGVNFWSILQSAPSAKFCTVSISPW